MFTLNENCISQTLPYYFKMNRYLMQWACCFVWVWDLVVDTAGGKKAEGVWEHGVEESVWTQEGQSNGGMEEIV